MMPDKIYLREFPDGIARFWESKRKDDVVATIQHEYIRKDALMEWAKELTSEPYNRTTESARKHQIARYLLEKYNSL